MNARSTTPARPAESSRVPTFICHCERPSTGSGRAGMSMRLNTRRRTAVATTTGLPRYARNDKVDTHTATGLPRYARNDKVDTQGQLSPVCWHRRRGGGNCSDLWGSTGHQASYRGAAKHGICFASRLVPSNVNSYWWRSRLVWAAILCYNSSAREVRLADGHLLTSRRRCTAIVCATNGGG